MAVEKCDTCDASAAGLKMSWRHTNGSVVAFVCLQARSAAAIKSSAASNASCPFQSSCSITHQDAATIWPTLGVNFTHFCQEHVNQALWSIRHCGIVSKHVCRLLVPMNCLAILLAPKVLGMANFVHDRKYHQSLYLFTLPFGEKGCSKPPAAPEPPDPCASITTSAEVSAWVLACASD